MQIIWYPYKNCFFKSNIVSRSENSQHYKSQHTNTKHNKGGVLNVNNLKNQQDEVIGGSGISI